MVTDFEPTGMFATSLDSFTLSHHRSRNHNKMVMVMVMVIIMYPICKKALLCLLACVQTKNGSFLC